MKKILFSVFAVAALASCAQEEIINQGSAIDFGAPFVGNTTKADDPSYGQNAVDLEKFNVYGTVQGTGAGVVNIFDGAEVTGSIGNAVWNCGVKQYWIEGAQYNFAAVVDAKEVESNATTKLPATLTPAMTSESYYKDMLYAFNGPITATANAETGAYAPVNFAFEHLLSKAQFTVTSNTKDGYYYNVKDIKIQNIHTDAVYTIGTIVDGKDTGTWAGTLSDSVNDWFSLGNIEKITAANTTEATTGDKYLTNKTQVLLIPTTTDFKVEFVVELWNDNGAEDDVLLRTINCTGENAKTITIDLVKGCAYNFNLALTTGSEILFTVTSQPTWNSADSGLTL